MPFDGSGNFQRVMNWVADAAAGIRIKSDRHDTEDNNFAAGLSNTITKDGQTVVVANIPFNGKRLVNIGAPAAAGDAVNRQYVDERSGIVAVNPGPPATAFNGSLWWDNDTGKLYIRYQDADSVQWVEVTASTGGLGALVNIARTVIEGNVASGGDITGNYVKPADLKFVEVELWAGGGAGGGVQTPATGERGAGVGGGGGGYCRKLYKASDLAASEPYVIGKGGNTPSAVGGDGSNSTFKGMLANGGIGGGITSPSASGQGNRVSGGGASGGDENITGSHGGTAFWSVPAGLICAGNGGNAPGGGYVGGRGSGASGASANGSSGQAPGGGGAGGAVANTAGGAAGGLGAGGRMVLTEYF